VKTGLPGIDAKWRAGDRGKSLCRAAGTANLLNLNSLNWSQLPVPRNQCVTMVAYSEGMTVNEL